MIIPEPLPQIGHSCPRCGRLHTSVFESANCCFNSDKRRIDWPQMPEQKPYQPMAPTIDPEKIKPIGQNIKKSPMAALYPAYYKDVSHISEIDVYMVHYLFDIKDPSGAIQHASKKLLLSGTRTGGKSMFKDIKEARDTLNRWLEMNPEK